MIVAPVASIWTHRRSLGLLGESGHHSTARVMGNIPYRQPLSFDGKLGWNGDSQSVAVFPKPRRLKGGILVRVLAAGGSSTRSRKAFGPGNLQLLGAPADVNFQVLGPLTARCGGEICNLGGPRQQMVLAILLANADMVISRDALIEAVWAGNPPPAARTSLHTYLSHLREALGPDTISTINGGYVIHASPENLDSLQFENMINEGRRLSDSDVRSAANLFNRALSLWRGAPFGDFGEQPDLITERERLTELRILTFEYRADAYLELSRNGEVIAELPGLIREHPYRERFYGQLMLALYRSGRQADALRVFGDVRRRLADDLGVDPTPELWALEEQILSHDPELTGITTAQPENGHPVFPLADLRAVAEAPSGFSPDEATTPMSADPERDVSATPRHRRTISSVLAFGLVIIASGGLLAGGVGWADSPKDATATGCLVPPAEITAWWTGDGDDADLIGGRDANLVHGVTHGPGVVGTAFYLDGDGFVDVAHDPSLDPGREDFTIDLWARFDSTDGEQVLVEKWVQTWSDHETMGWTFTKLADNSIGFFSEGVGWALGVRSTPQDIPLDTWTHFAARRHGETVEILINGELVASQTHPGGEDSYIGSVASLKFGHRGSVYDTSGSLDESDFYLQGAIDEVHLAVGTSLSDEDIRDLVDARSQGYCRT